MEISITVPDDVGQQLSHQWRDLPRHALEALVADAYRHGVLTAGQVRRLLGLPTRLEVDGFLKQAGAYLHYSEQDLEDDSRTLEALLAR
jgi:Uncharacterised protein family (UPF0175)